MFFWSRKKRIYLDYASATPVRKEVLSVMLPYFTDAFGNAGAIHALGVQASHAIAEARQTLARLLHIRPEGIVFTASGTESNNLAIFGTIADRRKEGVAYTDMEVISTAIEHPSVLKVLHALSLLGVTITLVQVDTEGLIDTEVFETALSDKTVLVTCAYVNSEIGVIQNVGKLARIVRAYEKEHNTIIRMHVDAAQAPLWLPCALDTLGCDMVSLDAGKCYGPKGIGVLALRHGVTLSPYLFGGSQEGGLRPGTENTPLIIGAVEAIKIAQENYKMRSDKVTALKDMFIKELSAIEGVVLNGSRDFRVANNVNISIVGIDSEFAVITLDQNKIAAATKSACGTATGDGSSVVRNCTHDDARAKSTIRFSLGEETTAGELRTTLAVLKTHIAKTRIAHQSLTK